MPVQKVNFRNFGYLTNKFTDAQLLPISNEVEEIQLNFEESKKLNHTLAGHLKHEYELVKSKNYLEELLLPYVLEYEKEFDYFKTISVLTDRTYAALDTVWVNFQQKNEFNPIHTHSGIMSFVIWLKIPYNIEDEKSFLNTGIQDYEKRNGHFGFLYTNSLGDIVESTIPVDRTYEGTMALFPARMNHCVYPFYTSEDYRITVSGNFKLKI